MGRLRKRHERERYSRRLKLRTFIGFVLCLGLFYCGLVVVDGSFKDMIGENNKSPIFGIYGLGEPVVTLEFAGNEVSIDKTEWEKAYKSIKERIERFIGRQWEGERVAGD